MKGTDFSFDHECEKKGSNKNMAINASIASVDDFIAEKIVQSMYPKGDSDGEKEERDVFEVENIIGNKNDNEKSMFHF